MDMIKVILTENLSQINKQENHNKQTLFKLGIYYQTSIPFVQQWSSLTY
ncbi:MAG: hypothetical protein AB8W37_09735 [Arsenophonus endosymbiont of Dermacentor nuttalli]